MLMHLHDAWRKKVVIDCQLQEENSQLIKLAQFSLICISLFYARWIKNCSIKNLILLLQMYVNKNTCMRYRHRGKIFLVYFHTHISNVILFTAKNVRRKDKCSCNQTIKHMLTYAFVRDKNNAKNENSVYTVTLILRKLKQFENYAYFLLV